MTTQELTDHLHIAYRVVVAPWYKVEIIDYAARRLVRQGGHPDLKHCNVAP